MDVSVSLTGELADFVAARLAHGGYASSGELIIDALRLMRRIDEKEAENLRFLRDAWAEGIDSGDAGPVDFGALKTEARARFATRES